MTVVVVVGAIAVVGAVVVGATWRRSDDERQSVNDYHHTIETLRHLADRNAPRLANGGQDEQGRSSQSPGQASGARRQTEPVQGSYRGSVPGAAASARRGPGPPASGSSPQSPAASLSGLLIGRSSPQRNGNGEEAELGAPPRGRAGAKVIVFGDDRVSPSDTVSKLASGRPVFRQAPRSLKSGPSSLRPQRRSLLGVAAVVLLVGVVAAAVAFNPLKKNHPSAPTSSNRHSSTSSTSANSPSRGSPANANSNRSSSSHSSTSSNPKEKPSTTSTAPPTLEPTSFTAVAATYAPSSSAYTLYLSATGPCWILATDSSTGQVLWTGTMQAGETRQIPATGATLVRLGAAFSISLTVDGVPVVLPPGHSSPYDVTFEPT